MVSGEEFNLTVSDRSLNGVLRRHIDIANVELNETPVVREDGSEGIIDLMLSRVVRELWKALCEVVLPSGNEFNGFTEVAEWSVTIPLRLKQPFRI